MKYREIDDKAGHFFCILSIIFCLQVNDVEVYATLEAILTVMSTYISQEKPVIAQKMIDCAKVLHGMTLLFHNFITFHARFRRRIYGSKGSFNLSKLW